MRLFLVLAASLLATAASAQVTATDAQAALTGHGMARVTATLTSPIADTLIAASSPAGDAAVHTVGRRGSNSVMQPTTVKLVPHVPRRLSVHGDHVMLMGLKPGVHAGQAIPVTLTFAHSAPLSVQAVVR